MRGAKSLSVLVRDYMGRDSRRLADYLGYFEGLESLEDAIRFACHGREGRIHVHQRRVGKATLERARKALQRRAGDIRSCRSFAELHACVKEGTKGVRGFGPLGVYDTSLRLGAHLGLRPEVVYLHAGTRKGCQALGLTAGGGTVEMGELPRAVAALEPYEAEDFLCIFKDRLGGMDGQVKGCLPKGC